MGLTMAKPCAAPQRQTDLVIHFFEAEAFDSWYAVQTLPRHEKAVTTQITAEGLPCVLPLENRRRRWSDREQEVQFPLFPGYMFVRLENYAQQHVHVLRKPGVVRFVGMRNRAEC